MENRKWRTLYRAGAVAPLIALALYASQFIILFFGDPYPTTIEGWFALFQRSKLLGLWYLNALDIVSFALLGIMFLALYVALRRARPSWMLIALYLALLGVVVFIVPRVLTLSVLPLSDLHAAATTEAQRTMYLTAGEALSQVTTATPQTLGFLFMAVAGLIISVVILRSRSFDSLPVLAKLWQSSRLCGHRRIRRSTGQLYQLAPCPIRRRHSHAHQRPAVVSMVDHDLRGPVQAGRDRLGRGPRSFVTSE